MKQKLAAPAEGTLLLFDDATGDQIDFNPGNPMSTETQRPGSADAQVKKRRGKGRPKLGVVSREVTLLPRHWDWLKEQRGSVSVVLRRLVETASREGRAEAAARMSRDAIHGFLWRTVGDQPGFEEASRAFYAADYDAFEERAAAWPDDVRLYASKLIAETLVPLERQAKEACG